MKLFRYYICGVEYDVEIFMKKLMKKFQGDTSCVYVNYRNARGFVWNGNKIMAKEYNNIVILNNFKLYMDGKPIRNVRELFM